jgi:hypothetical protein
VDHSCLPLRLVSLTWLSMMGGVGVFHGSRNYSDEATVVHFCECFKGRTFCGLVFMDGKTEREANYALQTEIGHISKCASSMWIRPRSRVGFRWLR